MDAPVNNSIITAETLTRNSYNIWVNITHNTSGDYTTIFNDSRWTLNSNTSTKRYYLNNTAIDDGIVSIYFAINKSGSDNGTGQVLFTVDTVLPNIDPLLKLLNNDTHVYNGTLSTQINFSDTQELYSVNVTVANGTVIFNRSQISSTSYVLNLSHAVDETISNSMLVEVCDGHTDKNIKPIDYRKENQGLKFVIEDRPWLAMDDWIHIYPKTRADYDPAETEKLNDRYTFTFNRKNAPSTETFIVESSHFIDIIENSKYDGHLIIPGMKNGYWVDFENDESSKVDIDRITDTKVEIKVHGLTNEKIKFNSIGELNCYNQTYYFGNLNPVIDFDNFVLAGETSTFNLNISRDAVTMSSFNATLYYNNTIYYAGVVSNFSSDVEIPLIGSTNSTNISFTWVLDVDGYDYNLTSYQQNISNFFIDNCTAYTTKALNITMRNITNESTINGPMEFFFNYSYDGTARTYSYAVTDNATNICIFPGYISIISDIWIEYAAPSSDTFTYRDEDVTLSNVSQLINLYVSDGTTLVTLTVRDENDDPVEDVTIQIQEWDVGSGTYKTTQQLLSNKDGEAFAYLILDDVNYKFVLEFGGATVLETDAAKVTTTTKEFRIVLGTTTESIYQKINNLQYDLSASRTDKTFNLTWANFNAVASSVLFYVEYTNYTDGNVQVYNVNSTDDDGSAGYAITTSNVNTSTIYTASVYIISVDDGQRYFLDSIDLTFREEWELFGDEALFMSYLFVGTMIFIGVAVSIPVAVALSSLGLVIFVWMGFIKLAVASVVTLICGLMFLLRGNR